MLKNSIASISKKMGARSHSSLNYNEFKIPSGKIRKIKVIVRKIGGNGNMHFWSIIPAWITNKYRDTKFDTTMKCNPDEDLKQKCRFKAVS